MRHILVPMLIAGLSTGCLSGLFSSEDDAPDAPSHPLPPANDDLGRPVASVNGLPIGTANLERARGTRVPDEGSTFSPEERASLVEKVVEEELLFQEAFQRGLYQDPSLRRALIARLLKAEVYDKTDLPEHSEEDMKAWFDDHKEMFVIPERVHIQRIFLVPGASRDADATRALAETLREQAEADPDRFPELAREHSDGPLALRSGDAGYVAQTGRPEIPPELVSRAFNMREGALSEIIEQGGGLNLLRVPGRRPRVERTFEQVRSAIRRRMNEAFIQDKRTAFVQGLREQATVKVNDSAIQAWRPTFSRGVPDLPEPTARPERPDDVEPTQPALREQILDDPDPPADEEPTP